MSRAKTKLKKSLQNPENTTPPPAKNTYCNKKIKKKLKKNQNTPLI
jgi:hypothetical protein